MKLLKPEIVYPLLIFAVMLISGMLIFNSIEGWSYLDSLYFSVVTMTTVGYGDFTPTHSLSKIMVMIYAVSGISFFLYFVSVIAYHFIKESQRRFEKGAVGLTRMVRRLPYPRSKLVKEVNEITSDTESIDPYTIDPYTKAKNGKSEAKQPLP